MIRQAISCDICGAEKRQTNHWFVAYAHGGELRFTGLTSNTRLRPGSKHLCGQTCLHKLVDEFIAGNAASRPQPAVADAADAGVQAVATDTSLTSGAAYTGAIPSSPAIASPLVPSRSATVIPAAVIAIAPTRAAEEPRPRVAAPVVDDTPNYASRHWRAEAWERERERERRSALANHRKSS